MNSGFWRYLYHQWLIVKAWTRAMLGVVLVTSALVGCGNADWATSPKKDPLSSCLSGGLIVGKSLELQWSLPPEDPPAYVRSNRAHKKPEVSESLLEEEHCDLAGDLRSYRSLCLRSSRSSEGQCPVLAARWNLRPLENRSEWASVSRSLTLGPRSSWLLLW